MLSKTDSERKIEYMAGRTTGTKVTAKNWSYVKI